MRKVIQWLIRNLLRPRKYWSYLDNDLKYEFINFIIERYPNPLCMKLRNSESVGIICKQDKE